MNNTLNVNFEEGKIIAKAGGLWQWDKGQKMRIFGTGIRANVETHFSLMEKGGISKKLIASYDSGLDAIIADIPDAFLADESLVDYKLYAFLYVRGEGTAETVYKIILTVKARPKPEGYEEADIGIDDYPTEGSGNLVKSGGVYDALEGKTESFKVTFTSTYDQQASDFPSTVSDRSLAEILEAVRIGKHVYAVHRFVYGDDQVSERYLPLLESNEAYVGDRLVGQACFGTKSTDYYPQSGQWSPRNSEITVYSETVQSPEHVEWIDNSDVLVTKTELDALEERIAESFKVTVTYSDGVATCDKTYAEITAALNAGKYVYAELTTRIDDSQTVRTVSILPYNAWVNRAALLFGHVRLEDNNGAIEVHHDAVYIYSDDTVDVLSDYGFTVVPTSDFQYLVSRVEALEQAIATT